METQNSPTSLTADALLEPIIEPAGLTIKFTIDELGTSLIGDIVGRMDAPSMDTFRKALRAQHASQGSPKHMILNLCELEYISSVGFREIFLLGRKLTQGGGSLAVCGLNPRLHELFDIAQFHTVYPIYGDREEAISHARQKSAQ